MKKSTFNKIGIFASLGAVVMSGLIMATGGSSVYLFASIAILCANLTIYFVQKKKNNNEPK